MEVLQGAVFSGHLSPPDAARCELTYRFGEPMKGPLPAAVRSQRLSLGWSAEAQGVLAAVVSLPALDIDREDVVASLDRPTGDGCTRLLIQSLRRPELGLTILVLAADGQSLAGGDESWSRGSPPLIAATRREEPTSPTSPSRPPAAPGTGKPVAPTRPAAPPSSGGARRPSPRRGGLGVAPGTAAAPPVAQAYPARGAGAPAPPNAPPRAEALVEPEPRYEGANSVIGGDCAGRPIAFRGDSDAARRVAASAKAGGGATAEAPSLRPDLLTGEPRRVAQLAAAGPGALDAEIKAAQAEVVERLVAAAAAGETGDLVQLGARAGLDKAPAAGQHEGLTALMAAAERGRGEAVKLLIDKKSDLECADPNGWTALMHAVQGQRSETVRLLLEARAFVNAAAEADGRLTPLILAAAGARPEICSTLLAAGAKPGSRDTEGRRALHHAAKKGNNGALLALLNAGAKMEDVTVDGLTPLLLAAAAGRAESVRILLARGADVKATDQQGRTASKIAGIYEHDRVLRALQEARGGT